MRGIAGAGRGFFISSVVTVPVAVERNGLWREARAERGAGNALWPVAVHRHQAGGAAQNSSVCLSLTPFVHLSFSPFLPSHRTD